MNVYNEYMFLYIHLCMHYYTSAGYHADVAIIQRNSNFVPVIYNLLFNNDFNDLGLLAG